MNTAIFEPTATLQFQAFEPAELNELVRGQDAVLLEHIGPLVLARSVTLDLAAVERIDAAGISALVTLYRSAREAGHWFSVTNASPHVAEILAVVGLDRFLISHNAVHSSHYDSQMERPAA